MVLDDLRIRRSMRPGFLVFLTLLLLGGCATVRPGEAAVMFRPFCTEAPTIVVDEGTRAKAPWVRVNRYQMRWQTAEEEIEVQTSDRVHLKVKAAVTYRPLRERLDDLRRALGPSYYETAIRPTLHREIRDHFADAAHDAVAADAKSVLTPAEADVRKELGDLGIEVSEVTIFDVDFPSGVADALAERIAAQQRSRSVDAQMDLARREAELSLAKVQAEAQTRLAAKELDLQVARKDAEIELVRARSTAEAQKARSATLTPALLKLRAIEAQEAIAKSPTAKVVYLPAGGDLIVHVGGAE